MQARRLSMIEAATNVVAGSCSPCCFSCCALRHPYPAYQIRIWARVACLWAAISPSRSTSVWFALRASGVKRGTILRKSVLSNFVFSGG
jgi:hypothetical protein